MYQIIHYLDENENDVYQSWLDSLRDRTAKIAVIRRVARVEIGLFGDCKQLRDGISELVPIQKHNKLILFNKS